MNRLGDMDIFVLSTWPLTGHCSTCKQKTLTQSRPLARADFLSFPQGPTLIHRNALVGTQKRLMPAVHMKDILPVFLEIMPQALLSQCLLVEEGWPKQFYF